MLLNQNFLYNITSIIYILTDNKYSFLFLEHRRAVHKYKFEYSEEQYINNSVYSTVLRYIDSYRSLPPEKIVRKAQVSLLANVTADSTRNFRSQDRPFQKIHAWYRK